MDVVLDVRVGGRSPVARIEAAMAPDEHVDLVAGYARAVADAGDAAGMTSFLSLLLDVSPLFAEVGDVPFLATMREALDPPVCA